MSEPNKYVVPLYDHKGKLHTITLAPEIWDLVGTKLEPILQEAVDILDGKKEKPAPAQTPPPMDDWKDFKDYWDFKYPFNAEVKCLACSAEVKDWENDPFQNFILRGANLSGLVTFECTKCSARVQKKHFKDHICFEAITRSGEKFTSCFTEDV